jgi:hypothetical protein
MGKKIPDSPKKGDRSMGKSSKRQMLVSNEMARGKELVVDSWAAWLNLRVRSR